MDEDHSWTYVFNDNIDEGRKDGECFAYRMSATTMRGPRDFSEALPEGVSW